MKRMGQYFETAKKRLGDINWEFIDGHRPSHEVLIREYFRRLNNFYDWCNYQEQDRSFFLNIGKFVDADLPTDEIHNACRELIKAPSRTFIICDMYLRWSYVMDQELPVTLQFHDLFDPILKLFERGGRFRQDHGGIICGSLFINRDISVYPERSFPLDISDEALDKYDNQFYYQVINDLLEKYGLTLDEKEKAVFMQKIQNYQHATSKGIMIRVELAKLIWNKGINLTAEQLKEIKEKIEWYSLFGLEKWVSAEEWNNLMTEMTEVLDRLNALE